MQLSNEVGKAVGFLVGLKVGLIVVGFSEGLLVVGFSVGFSEGFTVVGFSVGFLEGFLVVGECVGCLVVGFLVGSVVGSGVGACVGALQKDGPEKRIICSVRRLNRSNYIGRGLGWRGGWGRSESQDNDNHKYCEPPSHLPRGACKVK